MSQLVDLKTSRAFRFLGLLTFALLLLYPGIKLMAVAFGSAGQSAADSVFADASWARWVTNSACVAMALAAGAVITATVVASAFSRSRSRHDGSCAARIPNTTLLAMPLLLLPVYGAAVRFGAVNPHLGFIIMCAAMTLPFCFCRLTAHFNLIPPSALEAARLDGASRSDIIRSIVLPLVWRGVLTTALFSFSIAYMFCILTALFVPESAIFFSGWPLATPMTDGGARPGIYAGAILLVLPLLLCFSILSRDVPVDDACGAGACCR